MAITKVINSESQAYRPVLTDTLVLDAVPTVNSFNGVTSDAVARAVAGASGEVPQVTENDNGKVLKAIYDAGGPAVEWGEATVDQNYDATSTNAQSGTAVAQAIAAIPSASYTAGDGIDISEQGAISAVGGTGITVTAESTTTQSITVHTQDYAYSWMPGTEYHSVTYVSVLDSSLVSDIQNGGIDVTLSHSFYQSCDSNLNSYKNDWLNNPNQFKAYAAIVYLSAHGSTTPTAYFGYTGTRLVLGEVSAPWIDNNQGFPAIAANTVVSYDFDDVNTTLSTITLSDVLANPSDYCMTVLFLDTRINAFDDGGHIACTMADVTGAGNYTTGTLVVTVPGAINVANPLPASAVGDAGKVLTVSAAGAAEWATPSGGGSSKTTIGYATNDFSGSSSEQYLVVGASSAMTLQPDTQLEITLDIVNKSNSYPSNVTFDINFLYYSNNNYYIWLGTYKQVATWAFAGLTQVTYHVMGSKQANYPFATTDTSNMINNIVVAIKCSNNSLAYTATATIKQIS